MTALSMTSLTVYIYASPQSEKIVPESHTVYTCSSSKLLWWFELSQLSLSCLSSSVCLNVCWSLFLHRWESCHAPAPHTMHLHHTDFSIVLWMIELSVRNCVLMWAEKSIYTRAIYCLWGDAGSVPVSLHGGATKYIAVLYTCSTRVKIYTRHRCSAVTSVSSLSLWCPRHEQSSD